MSALIAAVAVGGVAVPVAAEEECADGCVAEPDETPTEVTTPTFDDGPPVERKAAATRVRKAFLQAKKAFHEARQDIQAIKKGDQGPTEVPTFFDDSDDEADG